jgi:hypothetical protein
VLRRLDAPLGILSGFQTDQLPRNDHSGVDLISDALPFGRLWYGEIPHAIGYAKFYSRSHDAVIRIYDAVDESRCGFAGESVVNVANASHS